MALHESQSWPSRAARQPPRLCHRLAPLVAQAFRRATAFRAQNLHRLLTRVRPGLIRVDADE